MQVEETESMIEKDGESLEKVMENVEDDEESLETVMENVDCCETMNQQVPIDPGQCTPCQHIQCQPTSWCQHYQHLATYPRPVLCCHPVS